MAKSGNARKGDNTTAARRFNGGRDGRVSAERHVRPVFVVVEAWCKKTGHELVSIEAKPGYGEATVERPR